MNKTVFSVGTSSTTSKIKGAGVFKKLAFCFVAASTFCGALISNHANAQVTLGQQWEFNDASSLGLAAVANSGALPSQWVAASGSTIPASLATNASDSLRIGYNGTSSANAFAPINMPVANVGGVVAATIVFKDWDIKNGAESGFTRPIYNFSLRSAASTSSSIVAQVIFTATTAGVVMTVRDTSANIYPIATLPSKLTAPLSVTLSVDKSATIKTYTLSYTIQGGEQFSQTGNLDAGGNARIISHVSLGISGNFPGTGNPTLNVAPLIDRIAITTGPAPIVTTGPPENGRPGMPSNLLTYFDGNRVQANKPAIGGPGLMLMGGGAEVDAAFLSRAYPIINGGDIVVLRVSGGNGYQAYFNQILVDKLQGELKTTLKPNSVETLFVDTRDKANSDYVENAVAHANMIWMSGGDQSAYIDNWRDTKLAAAVKAAFSRGAVVGGTSAGMVVSGEWMYDPGLITAATSLTAVANPYNGAMSLSASKLFDLPLGFNLLNEPHFQNRDRMGRTLAFMARLRKDARTSLVYGVALDEGTSLFIDKNNLGTFDAQHGRLDKSSPGCTIDPFCIKPDGNGYILREDRRKTTLTQVTPGLPLIYRNALRIKLAPAQSFDFARGVSAQPAAFISVEGALPVNPY
jgi:peptidase E